MGGIPAVGGAYTLRQAEKLAERAAESEATARPAPKTPLKADGEPAPDTADKGEGDGN